MESPLEPYVAHYPMARATSPPPPELLAQWEAEERPFLDLALDADPDATNRWVYRNILLDNLVHEFNMLRGAFGDELGDDSAERPCRGVEFRERFQPGDGPGERDRAQLAAFDSTALVWLPPT